MEISGVSTSRTQAWANYSRTCLDGIPQGLQDLPAARAPADQPRAANNRRINYAGGCVHM